MRVNFQDVVAGASCLGLSLEAGDELGKRPKRDVRGDDAGRRSRLQPGQ
jgi:hypothetical protein